MRKHICLTLILTLLMSVFPIAMPVRASLAGKGTDADPYIIRNGEDFLEIKKNPSASYILNADIVLPSGFTPFEFSGKLIGNDTGKLKKININLLKEESDTNNPAGLFTKLTGLSTIKNICLTGTVTGGSVVGGFAGKADGSTGSVIENCINEATIIGTNNVGGIVAIQNATTIISGCVNAGNIYGDTYIGGIASQTSTGKIELCSNVANVTATGSYAGGIVGRNYGFVDYCYNTGNIKGNNYVGGIIAFVNGTRAASYLYNLGTIEARTSRMTQDCGGIVGGIAEGTNRFLKLTRAYNAGDVISPAGNFNPIYAKFNSADESNYITLTDAIYLSEDKKDDGAEGSEPVSKDDFPTIEEFMGEFHSIFDKVITDNNTGWMDDILNQLDCELAMYKGNRIAITNVGGKAEMLRVDDEDIKVVPKIKNGSTVVPVGFVSRVFGAEVKWLPESRSVEIKTSDKNIIIGIDSDKASVNGNEITLSQPAYIENGRTFVPLRAVAEMLGKNVYWNNCGVILIGKNKINPSDEFVSLAKSIWVIPAQDLTAKLKTAQPGDEIIVANGTYKDVVINVDLQATEDKPVVIRAETPGGVEFTGTSRWTVTGSYITVRDFYFNEAISSDITVKLTNVYKCRVTGCYFYRTGHATNGQSALVEISGNSKYNRVDHNTFERPQGMCVRYSINGATIREKNNTDGMVDHNYFLDVRQCSVEIPTSSSNGMEVVNLIGGSALPYEVNHTVQYNRFEDVYGDGGEGICLKSHGNKINYNTFLNSQMSGLSMRANENSEVIGNFWFHTKYGLRVYGQGAYFKNNYCFDSYRSGFVAHGGSHAGGNTDDGSNQAACDYTAEDNLIIYPNHAGLMHSDNFNADNGVSAGTTRLTYKNNKFYLRKGSVLKDYRSSLVTYEGNKVNLSGSGIIGDAEGIEGFEYTDVPLVFDGEIWLPENQLDFDKQGLISVSECGPEDRWWEPLLRYTPKYFFDIEPDGKPVSLTPRLSYITINTNEAYDIRGLSLTANYDADYLQRKGIEKQWEDITYTSKDSNLILKDGYLTCKVPGEYKLSLSYKGLSKDIKVKVVNEYSGAELLTDNFDDGDNSAYQAHAGSKWPVVDGALKSKGSSTVYNNEKILKGNYEINFDLTLTDDSGSGAIGGGLVLGYRNSPDFSHYTLRFGDSDATATGFYEIDPHVTLKSSEMQISLEANKKYNITVRVNGKTVTAFVDGKWATLLENFKNNEGKIGFISYSNNSVIVDNLTVKEFNPPVQGTDISDLNMTSKRVDSQIAVVDYVPMEQKNIYYRTYKNGFQINDAIDENEGFSEVTLRVDDPYYFEVKAFDEFGNIVGNSKTTVHYPTDGKDEFFTISDVLFYTGDPDYPYDPASTKYRSRGLKVDLSTYSDRAYKFTEIPERFIDCGFIKMHNTAIKTDVFRKSAETGNYLKFDINRPATVYVLAYIKGTGNFPLWASDWKYETVSDVQQTTSNPNHCWSKHFDVPAGGKTTVYVGGFAATPVAPMVFIKPDDMPEYVELKKIPLGLF